MKNENDITLIVFLFIIIIVCSGIFAFMAFSNGNDNTSALNNTYNTNNQNYSSNSININNLGKEFKRAMDSYEAFMDEYIAFMMKYTNSTAKTSQMLIDYGEYMKKYIDVVDAFEKWKSIDLNTEEAKYYIEVSMRVSQKLMNASINVQTSH